MGLFSFLTGTKKDDDVSESGSATAPAAEPHSFHPSEAQTPFKTPDAWDTAALTAPPPAQSVVDKPEVGPMDAAATAELQSKVVEQIKTVFDPEIPVDIYELGLVYDIIADAEKRVLVKMTLTSPACPSAQQIPSEVRYKVKAIPGVTNAWVEIVWEPPWDKERMSEAAKLQLGFF
jgi:FeS assembly SUF system protein